MAAIAAAGIGAAGALGSSAMSSGKSGKPAGNTTTSFNPFNTLSVTTGTNTLQNLMGEFNNGDWTALGAAPVTTLSPQTQDFLNTLTVKGNAGAPTIDNAAQLFNNIATGNFGGFYSPLQNLVSSAKGDFSTSPLLPLLGLSQGNFGSWNSPYQNLVSMAKGDFTSSPAYEGLSRAALGEYLPNSMPSVSGGTGGLTVGGSGNPFLDSLVNQAADRAQSGVNSSFGTSGRFGGGANSNALVSNIENSTAGILAPEYNFERQLQQQAQGILGGAQTGAATTLGGVQANAAGVLGNAQTGAVNTLSNAQTNAALQAPSMFQAGLLPAGLLQGVGSIWDTRNLQQQNAPYQSVQNYFSALTGAKGLGGSQSAPYFLPSLLSQGLGGALGGAALAKALGAGSGDGTSTGVGTGLSNWWNGLSWDGMDPNASTSGFTGVGGAPY